MQDKAFRGLTPILCSLWALWLAGCAGALNAVTSSAGYSVVEDVRYMPGARGTLDLYIPDGAQPDTPVVVFVHGGSWDTGSKDMYLFVGQSLASEGIIVAIPNYRLYPAVQFPGFVEDAARATVAVSSWAQRGENGLPAGRHPFFLMGHSAGAEIAGLLATDGRYLTDAGGSIGALDGFVGLSGPFDFLPLTEERYKRVFPEATRAASQPVNYIDGDEPPMLLIHGGADTVVDPKNTRSLAAKARAAGIPISDHIVPGVDHTGSIKAFATALELGDRSIRADVIEFVRQRSR
ncbi:carboxylesterase family protein [Fulvimarina pelagi HTCC2506]|uniref:Carboxylesterase family protein n=1 Tax=Fulvimarina pelagi HTCC2506 TaxID=314231 RepID=Q0G5R6_9HYPH|nr:alpha/beta hydrolase [Fulvimarina pelagi]EAU42998.1 carboxylesterase family protein [Fulvimarina pelagi HTCC2506]